MRGQADVAGRSDGVERHARADHCLALPVSAAQPHQLGARRSLPGAGLCALCRGG